ncbi:penicillin-binding protein 4-like [Mytilus californianus]|uniref:penicillin-binding protein 4-like n=1 Tax=Mytilus californianus TaxID=6549 RepID=UPI00224723BB|nr:penicillin-binding protein 4-like [Mytilus californianus]
MLAFLAFCFVARVVYGCTSCSTELNATLKDLMLCKSHLVVGLSVSVVKSDKVLFVGGYSNDNTSVTGDTVFQIASLTKAFASTLLVKLIEEKTEYSLDTKIKTILRNDQIFNDSLRSEFTTVRDLLSHRTGIPQNNRIRLDNNLTRSNLIHRLKYLKAEKEFRGSYIYSSLLYGLVTHLTEIIGGDTWENLVSKFLFEPLGMTSSTFVTTANPEKINLAQGYMDFYGELLPFPFGFSKYYGELCGSGCILTTAVDMTKWMTFYLNGGKLPDGKRLISEKAFKEITTAANTVPNDMYTYKYYTKPKVPVTNSITGYALGWRSGFYRGNRMFIHGGATFGYRAMLSWYPDADLGIFTVLTGNDPNYFIRQILHNYIFDVYTNQTPYLNSTTVCSYPQPWFDYTPRTKPNVTKSRAMSRQKKDYFGNYYNPAYGNIQVKDHEDMNKLTLIYGVSTFFLYPKETKDEFYGDSVGSTRYILNFYTFRFDIECDNPYLEIPTFESKSPPVFQKSRDNANRASTNYHSGFDQLTFLVVLYAVAQSRTF